MFFVLIILVAATFGVYIYLFDSFFGGFDFNTSKAAAEGLISLIQEKNLSTGNFVDLGSCRGGLAIKVASAVPSLKVVGIDNSSVRTFCARARSVFIKNVSFKKKDIFNADLSTADIIFIYLPQELMPNLEAKLLKEAKPDSTVVSNKVSFPSWQPSEISGQLFIYKKLKNAKI